MIGPTLMALTISELMNAHIWINVASTQTYLAGTLWFVAGLSILRGHNIWTRDWPVLITLIGWLAILGGLSRMCFPEPVQQGSQNTTMVLVLQIILLAAGIVLTLKAYVPVNKKI